MKHELSIPEGLRKQFEQLEQRLWRFDTIVCACGAIGSLVLSYGLIFISDRLWDTPALLRLIFTLAGIASCGAFLYGYGSRWVWGTRSFPVMARLVQRRYRRLGDRLLGIVELANEDKRPANFSPALVKAAIEQVANEASKVDFDQAVETKRPRRYAFALIAAVAVAAVFFLVAPQAGWNALMRWFRPGAERYTFVNLENLPDHLVVPQGEPFDLAVGLSAHSLLHPSTVKAQFERQEPTSAPVKSGVAVLHLAGQTQPVMLSLSAGDITRRIRIDPEFRPELKQLSAHVDLPTYLQYPAYDQKVEGGSFTYLKGSTVAFNGEATRALKQARLDIEKKLTSLKVNGSNFSTGSTILDGNAQWAFTWKDQLGLDAPAEMKLHIQQKDDAPPAVDCRGMAGTIAILQDETVHVDVASEDDYGIQTVGVRWQIAAKGAENASTPEERKIAEAGPQDKTCKGQFDFSPKLLHIPEDTAVAFCATATDRFPGRLAALSSVHQIYVLSRESHARLIQDELEKLNAELEELTRKQESLLEAAKTTRQQDPSKLSNDDTGKKLDDQQNEQKETADQLEKLAEKTAETMKEAGKNPDISPKTLQQWAKNAEMMNSLAQNNMPNAAQTLANAQATPNDRAPKLDQATAQEQEILKQMQQMQNDSEKSMEKLMMENLALRLRKIATSEKSIADNFQKMLPDIIGARADQLGAEAKQALADMAKLQDTSQKESTKVQGEITRMFERTKLDRYGDVSAAMEDSSTDESLGKLIKVVQDNVSVQAIQSTTAWGQQFEYWAQRIEDKDDSKQDDQNGQGGQGNGQMDPALMALLKLRQQQDMIRERTQALERQKKFDETYDADAKATSKEQEEARANSQQLQDDPQFPVPADQIGQVTKAMREAKELLDKPETGEATVGDQTDAINLLDQIIQDMAKKSGKSMSSLMAMMGAKPGSSNSGTGYFGGGSTDRANVRVQGSRNGEASEQRHVMQASGSEGAPLPAEYRDAIENYQRAVGQEKATP